VIIDCDIQNVEDVADQGSNAVFLDQICRQVALSSFPPGFSEFGDGSSKLLGPDNDFDAAIDLLFLDGSRLGCNKS
jgi:hypothetical protein